MRLIWDFRIFARSGSMTIYIYTVAFIGCFSGHSSLVMVHARNTMLDFCWTTKACLENWSLLKIHPWMMLIRYDKMMLNTSKCSWLSLFSFNLPWEKEHHIVQTVACRLCLEKAIASLYIRDQPIKWKVPLSWASKRWGWPGHNRSCENSPPQRDQRMRSCLSFFHLGVLFSIFLLVYIRTRIYIYI